MRKLTGLFLAGLFAFTVVSCVGTPNSPAAIEKSIYSQLQSGNYEKGMKIYFDNLKKDTKEVDPKEAENAISMFTDKAKESIEKKGGIKNFKIIAENIDKSGETASVLSRITYGNGEESDNTTQYEKVDGKWEISDSK